MYSNKPNKLLRSTAKLLRRAGDVVIAVMGVTGAGKSTFVNYLTNATLVIGHGLEVRQLQIRYVYENDEDSKELH